MNSPSTGSAPRCLPVTPRASTRTASRRPRLGTARPRRQRLPRVAHPSCRHRRLAAAAEDSWRRRKPRSTPVSGNLSTSTTSSRPPSPNSPEPPQSRSCPLRHAGRTRGPDHPSPMPARSSSATSTPMLEAFYIDAAAARLSQAAVMSCATTTSTTSPTASRRRLRAGRHRSRSTRCSTSPPCEDLIALTDEVGALLIIDEAHVGSADGSGLVAAAGQVRPSTSSSP